MKLYATVNALKEINGILTPVSKGQGSNQSLAIEIIAERLKGIPTRANVYRLSLNIGNDNELEAELLDYSTGEVMELTKDGWSNCNHYATGDKGLCVRCGYNTLHLTEKELKAKGEKQKTA